MPPRASQVYKTRLVFGPHGMIGQGICMAPDLVGRGATPDSIYAAPISTIALTHTPKDGAPEWT